MDPHRSLDAAGGGTSGAQPLVSVGLPVYDGERYLREAVDSILGQTYANLELIISDNASTDATEAICREYAARDPRVRYVRQETNRGAVWNFNHVFALARGEYFMWAAFDDRRHPEYVARCLAALEANPGAVMCCSEVALIDADGNELPDAAWPRGIRPVGASPRERAAAVARAAFWYDFYGLMRSDALRSVRQGRAVWGFDVVVLLEMCLRGPVLALPERLFYYRIFGEKTQADLAATLTPEAEAGSGVPVSWTEFVAELLRGVWAAPLPAATRALISADLLRELCWRNPAVRREVDAEGAASARRALARRHLPSFVMLSSILALVRVRRYAAALRGRAGRLVHPTHPAST